MGLQKLNGREKIVLTLLLMLMLAFTLLALSLKVIVIKDDHNDNHLQ